MGENQRITFGRELNNTCCHNANNMMNELISGASGALNVHPYMFNNTQTPPGRLELLVNNSALSYTDCYGECQHLQLNKIPLGSTPQALSVPFTIHS